MPKPHTVYRAPIAGGVPTIHFTFPAPIETDWYPGTHFDPRYLRTYPDMKTHGIRFYIGGKRRVIAQTTNLMTATRFADMAFCRFAPLRPCHAMDVRDDHLNFSLAQVTEDIEDVPEAVLLLDQIQMELEPVMLNKGTTGERIRSLEEKLERLESVISALVSEQRVLRDACALTKTDRGMPDAPA